MQTIKLNKKHLIPILFLLPILFIHVLVIVGPAIGSLYYSLTEWSGIGKADFIGIDNFKEILTGDKLFRKAITHNFQWIGFCSLSFIMGLGVATLISSLKKHTMVIRAVLFIPYVLPAVVVANIWQNLLDPDLGFPSILLNMGFSIFDKALLGNASTALFTIFFVSNWRWWVFLMILLLAALQNVPDELYESARLDGANSVQSFFYITIPGIRPTLVFLILMVCIWTFQVFDYVRILTDGSPAGATEVLGTLVYKHAFKRLEVGYASAMGLTMSFVSGIFISLFLILKKAGWDI